MLRDDHLVYLMAWAFMVLSHLILFAPYVYASATGNSDFLVYWLEFVIVPSYTVIFTLVEVLFLYTIYHT